MMQIVCAKFVMWVRERSVIKTSKQKKKYVWLKQSKWWEEIKNKIIVTTENQTQKVLLGSVKTSAFLCVKLGDNSALGHRIDVIRPTLQRSLWFYIWKKNFKYLYLKDLSTGVIINGDKKKSVSIAGWKLTGHGNFYISTNRKSGDTEWTIWIK